MAQVHAQWTMMLYTSTAPPPHHCTIMLPSLYYKMALQGGGLAVLDANLVVIDTEVWLASMRTHASTLK